MLKRIKPIHKDIIRRLAVGEKPLAIASALGINPKHISRLMQDPVFLSAYREVEAAADLAAVERRGAWGTLEGASPNAAQLCADAVSGLIDKEVVPLHLRIRSAWDVLDRTGYTGLKRHVVGITDNPADLVINAYNEKHKAGGNGNG